MQVCKVRYIEPLASYDYSLGTYYNIASVLAILMSCVKYHTPVCGRRGALMRRVIESFESLTRSYLALRSEKLHSQIPDFTEEAASENNETKKNKRVHRVS